MSRVLDDTPSKSEIPHHHQRLGELVWIRLGRAPAAITVLQIFLGLGWMRAAAEKLIDPSWWSGQVIVDFLAEHRSVRLSWFSPLADLMIEPAAPLVALGVLLLQLVAAATLASGRWWGLGVAVGSLANLTFMAAGAVNPSIFYLLAQGALVLWWLESECPRNRLAPLLNRAVAAALVIAAFSLPDISTLHPAGVIEDPALVMGLTAALVLTGAEAVHRRRTGVGLP